LGVELNGVNNLCHTAPGDFHNNENNLNTQRKQTSNMQVRTSTSEHNNKTPSIIEPLHIMQDNISPHTCHQLFKNSFFDAFRDPVMMSMHRQNNQPALYNSSNTTTTTTTTTIIQHSQKPDACRHVEVSKMRYPSNKLEDVLTRYVPPKKKWEKKHLSQIRTMTQPYPTTTTSTSNANTTTSPTTPVEDNAYDSSSSSASSSSSSPSPTLDKMRKKHFAYTVTHTNNSNSNNNKRQRQTDDDEDYEEPVVDSEEEQEDMMVYEDDDDDDYIEATPVNTRSGRGRKPSSKTTSSRKSNKSSSNASGANNNTSSSSNKKSKINNGVWSEEEHERFVQGYKECGRNWSRIAKVFVKTRERTQIASHAQKWFKKLEKLGNVDGLEA
jgi:SHAQKYF class myb-like DNA-binding protein